jgi:hypothetical protein
MDEVGLLEDLKPEHAKAAIAVLQEAADHIERVGFFKGNYIDVSSGKPLEDCPCCILGAFRVPCLNAGKSMIDQSILQSPERRGARAAVTHFLGRPIAEWNDLPEQNKGTAIQALRQTALWVQQVFGL